MKKIEVTDPDYITLEINWDLIQLILKELGYKVSYKKVQRAVEKIMIKAVERIVDGK